MRCPTNILYEGQRRQCDKSRGHSGSCHLVDVISKKLPKAPVELSRECRLILMGVELGYRYAESGMNLLAALDKAESHFNRLAAPRGVAAAKE